MFFRCQYGLHDLGLGENQIVRFSESTPDQIDIEITQPPYPKSPEEHVCAAVVNLEQTVSSKVANQFAEITEAISKYNATRDFENQPKVPQAVIDRASLAARRISDFTRRVAKLMRWRMGLEGHHSPVKNSKGLHWSTDRQNWRFMSWMIRMDVSIIKPPIPPNDGMIKSFSELLSQGESEPLAHELLREAKNNKSRNPRSSLMIGIAAAEIGVKNFIAKLIPDAEWLAMNVPSPPLVQILENYVPKLPVKKRFGEGSGLGPFIPTHIREVFKKGVTVRNKLTHAGADFSTETLDQVLNATHDLLFLLDFYAGHEWAASWLSTETAEAINEEVGKLK